MNCHIATSTDNHYIQHATLMLMSLLAYTDSKITYNIYFFLAPDCTQERITKSQKSLGPYIKDNINLKYCDIPNGLRPDLPVKKQYLKEGIYDKLIIFTQLPKEVEKVVYLDSDIIMLTDIAILYKKDLEGNILAAVEDYYRKFSEKFKMIMNLPSDSDYFNSGVMLIDLKKWLNQEISRKAIDFVIKNHEVRKCHDQDGFNYAVKGRWLRLSKMWNPRPSNKIKRKNGKEEILLKNEVYRMRLPYLIHFSGGDKPWFYTSNHPMKKEYLKYLRRSRFKDYNYPDKNLKNAIIKFKNLIFWELIYFRRALVRLIKQYKV